MRLVVVGILHCCFLSWVAEANASLAYSLAGSTYTQNFDSLASSGTDNTWTNDTTLIGWHLFRATSGNPYNATPVAVNTYDASSGAGGAAEAEGKFFSFGTANNSERALGATGYPTFAGVGGFSFGVSLGWMAVSFTNDTGGTLPEFTVDFRGEQWRDAGNGSPDPQTMTFEYGFGNSFSAVSSWIAPGGSFDWASLVASDSKKAVDGNAAGLVTGLGGTVSGLTWTGGQTLWLRWREYNDAGSDHGLAIDNFSFSAGSAAVPEPSAYHFGFLICAIAGIAQIVRKFLAFGFFK